MIKLLCLGDVVGEEGVSFLEAGGRLRKLKQKYGADLVIVNGENSAKGNGMSVESAGRLYDAGADIITGGNHTFRRREIYNMLDDEKYLVRPANYPPEAPGMGYVITEVGMSRVLVMNVMGVVYLDPMTPPADVVAKILEGEKGNYDVAVCDIHAEATSEKMFLARYFDGRLSVVFGTHTHVATADAQVLPGGTGYITDLGMCGSMNGILGVKTESIVHKFTVKTPNVFEAASGNCMINGAYFEIDEKSGKCVSAERVECR